MEINKSLPSAKEAEATIVGTIQLDNSLISECIGRITANDFYTPRYRNIFIAEMSLFEKGLEITPIAILEELKREGLEEQCGGMVGINQTREGLPYLTSLKTEISVLTEKNYSREMIKLCSVTASKLMDNANVTETLDQHENAVFNIRSKQNTITTVSISSLVQQSAQMSLSIAKEQKRCLGLPTGYYDYDTITSGLREGNLIMLCGRPAMGKSSLAFDIARQVALRPEKRVVIVFSLEMTKEEVSDKLICAEAKVDTQRYKQGRLTQEEWARVGSTVDMFENAIIVIDDRPSLTALDMRAFCLRQKLIHKQIDLVIVDHIQLMKAQAGMVSTTRATEVSGICADLKSLAKFLKCPIIALSQLSREVEKRSPPIPKLSDCKESGGIEENADLVVMLYRPEYYFSGKEEGVCYLFIRKNRHGATGQVRLIFKKECGTFVNQLRNKYDIKTCFNES